MSSKLSTLLTSNPVAAAALAKADGLYLYDASASGSLKSAATLLSSLAGALFTYAASSNASGNTTLTLGALAMQHTEVTTVSGSGSTTRVMILELATSVPTAGASIRHRLALPATAEITVEWRNATAGGTLITSLLTDGSGDDAVVEFYYDGSAWQFLRFLSPANA